MIDWDRLKNQLKVDEGFRACVYQCSAGKATVGYGHNLEDEEMPEHIASALLEWKYMKVHEQLSDWQWYCELDDYRKEIIINMAFNVGVNGLLRFKKMINAIMDRDYQKAADEMVNSNWYNQVGFRAVRLVERMRIGQ